MSESGQDGYAGQLGLSSATSDFNVSWFLVRQILGLIHTATLVQIKAVTNSGDIDPVGTVDVMPLVNLIDGLGNASKHETIYGLPYARVQGGQNAIIIDPQVGDIGIAVFADRDISSVKANKAQANPGSRRRFDWADGVYLFSVITQTPNQYVRFNNSGINIFDINGNKIEMTPTGIKFTDLSGNIIQMSASGIAITGDLTNNTKNVGSTHQHGGIQSGGSNSGPPV